MTVTLYHGDCLQVMPTLDIERVDWVITDPPYPDYHVELYGQVSIDFLDIIPCPQLVFWSAKVDFPLSYTAIHIWDKKTGCGSQYERIFERNGQKTYRVYRHYLINSTVAASYAGDVFTGHPSQKPIKLINELIEKHTKKGQTIFDPFMGSGQVGLSCSSLGRNFIGIEKDDKWFQVAKQNIEIARDQLRFDISE